MTDFAVYDVFTDTPFGGNPLAVIPDAIGVPETDLQRIAREFNFSETTFVYPPQRLENTARVRIFTPTMEIPFAGHPVIGTAIALRDLGHVGEMVLELDVGPLPCRFDGPIAAFTTSRALKVLDHPSPSLVAEALGLPTSAIHMDTHVPVQASIGLPFVIAELVDEAALTACTTSIDAIKRGAKDHPKGHDFSLYAYTRTGGTIHARMFAPLDNIPEDPATGSAAATLAALLTETLKTAQSLRIQQGVVMGRPSIITAETEYQSPIPVTISGQAVQTMTGKLTY